MMHHRDVSHVGTSVLEVDVATRSGSVKKLRLRPQLYFKPLYCCRTVHLRRKYPMIHCCLGDKYQAQALISSSLVKVTNIQGVG